MANAADELSLLIGDIQIPEIFVVQYMERLSKDAVFFYLWIKTILNDKDFSEEEALKAAPYPENTIREILAELITADIIFKKDDKYCFVDLKRREVNSYCKAVAALGINPDTLQLTADEQTRNVLAESINKTCFSGKMGYAYYVLIDKCIGEYGFSNEVVYCLFEIGKQKKIQFILQRMSKLAEEWYKLGIVNMEMVDRYMKREKDIEKMTKLVGKLTRKHLNDFDIERIRKWVIDYNLGSDIVELAFRTNEYRGNITTQMVEDTLTLWMENGVKTVDEANIFEEEKHKENKRKAVKRKNRNSAWKTGAEAGIDNEEASDVKKDEVKETKEEKPQDEADDILDFFGDDDEDD